MIPENVPRFSDIFGDTRKSLISNFDLKEGVESIRYPIVIKPNNFDIRSERIYIYIEGL